jgi:hypothetical protein
MIFEAERRAWATVNSPIKAVAKKVAAVGARSRADPARGRVVAKAAGKRKDIDWIADPASREIVAALNWGGFVKASATRTDAE